jgi:hypothetical protein
VHDRFALRFIKRIEIAKHTHVPITPVLAAQRVVQSFPSKELLADAASE